MAHNNVTYTGIAVGTSAVAIGAERQGPECKHSGCSKGANVVSLKTGDLLCYDHVTMDKPKKNCDYCHRTSNEANGWTKNGKFYCDYCYMVCTRDEYCAFRDNNDVLKSLARVLDQVNS